MLLQLGAVFIVVGSHSGFLESTVHAFNLAVGPGVIGFGQPMIDIMAGTGGFKGMSPEDFAALPAQPDVGSGGSGIAGSSKVSAIVGQDSVDFVGNSFHECLQEVGGVASARALNQAGKSKLGRAIDGHKEQKFSLLGSNLCEIDVEVADGIGFELLLWPGLMTIQLRQSIDAMTLKAAMKSGTCELWNGGLQGVETVVQSEQSVLAKGHGNGLFFDAQRRGAAFLRTHWGILCEGSLSPLLDRLGVEVVALGQLQQALLTMLDRPTNRRRRAGAVV